MKFLYFTFKYISMMIFLLKFSKIANTLPRTGLQASVVLDQIPLQKTNEKGGSESELLISNNKYIKDESKLVVSETIEDYAEWEEYDSNSSEECPEEMFYHGRGKNCVPIHCPGGNKRDQNTGVCIGVNSADSLYGSTTTERYPVYGLGINKIYRTKAPRWNIQRHQPIRRGRRGGAGVSIYDRISRNYYVNKNGQVV